MEALRSINHISGLLLGGASLHLWRPHEVGRGEAQVDGGGGQLHLGVHTEN